MKDYRTIASKITKMGKFSDVHNCGSPTEHCPVNLHFQICEPYIIGYGFYVSYDWGKWRIDYTLNPSTTIRSDMQSISGIKTDREMFEKVKSLLNKIRHQCGVETQEL